MHVTTPLFSSQMLTDSCNKKRGMLHSAKHGPVPTFSDTCCMYQILDELIFFQTVKCLTFNILCFLHYYLRVTKICQSFHSVLIHNIATYTPLSSFKSFQRHPSNQTHKLLQVNQPHKCALCCKP